VGEVNTQAMAALTECKASLASISVADRALVLLKLAEWARVKAGVKWSTK